MKEKIGYPITLGEYEEIVKKERIINCPITLGEHEKLEKEREKENEV